MKRLTTEEFIIKAKLVHNNTYDYSLVNYVNSHDKVRIICSVHGEFEQRPNNHLNSGGCKKCYHDNNNIGNDNFISKAKQIHGDTYDYSVTKYLESKGKIKIICPIHGIFEQRASNHLSGKGCIKCHNKSRLSNDLEFIEKAKEKHGDRYDYSNLKYVNDKTKIKIICQNHGEFSQKPSNHLFGQGCPICRESKGERELRQLLKLNNIEYTPQYKFLNCKDKKVLAFDFYLPDYNTCIEYQGIQHYEPVKLFGGEEKFKIQQKRDKIKMEYCQNNNIPLIIIKYDESIVDKLNLLFDVSIIR
jgi:hypothetical protein